MTWTGGIAFRRPGQGEPQRCNGQRQCKSRGGLQVVLHQIGVTALYLAITTQTENNSLSARQPDRSRESPPWSLGLEILQKDVICFAVIRKILARLIHYRRKAHACFQEILVSNNA